VLQCSDSRERSLRWQAGGDAPFPGEDAIAVQLVKKAQALEREINRLQGDRQGVISSKHHTPEGE
jgi:hypothetical protein